MGNCKLRWFIFLGMIFGLNCCDPSQLSFQDVRTGCREGYGLLGMAGPVVWMLSVSCLGANTASVRVGWQSEVFSKLDQDNEIFCRQCSGIEKELVCDFAMVMYRSKNVADTLY